MIEAIEIIPTTTDAHIDGFHHCLDVVARERRYLAFLKAPPIEAVRAFVRGSLAGGGIHVVAIDSTGSVVGWCDITRSELEGFRHVGRLGMGLLPDARGHGVARRLTTAAIEAAFARGYERIELDVFASNGNAIALYEKLGFVHEGVKRHARKLDGVYDDNVCMALLSESR